MNISVAIAYVRNTIEYNDLEFGSHRQLKEVLMFIEQQQAEVERLKGEIDKRDMMLIGYYNEIQSLKEELEAERKNHVD